MPTFDYVLLTTCDARGERLTDLTRLLNSINAEIEAHGLHIRHYILLQNVNSLPEPLAASVHAQRIFLFVPHRLSLSRARNRMLRQALRDGALSSAKLCAFPDDDAWYPPNSLALILNSCNQQPRMGVWTCDYGSIPVVAGTAGEAVFRELADCGLFVRRVSSNTLFLRADMVEAVGFFDERLGVGGTINGGEDLDFALRAYLRAGHTAMIHDGPLIGHRDRLPWIRSQYFAGSLFAIARNAGRDMPLALQLLRKIAVGGFLAVSGELPARAFLSGLRQGLSGLFLRQPSVAPFE